MRDNYDFSAAKRGPVVPTDGKTRITMYVDNDVLATFRELAEQEGTGYQTLINRALKTYLRSQKPDPLTDDVLRKILREELQAIATKR